MKRSLLRKIPLSNAIIMLVSLLVFCSIAIIVYNQSMYQNIRKQLIIENKAASIVAMASGSGNVLVKALSDSITLVYTKKAPEETLELTYSSDETFAFPISIEELISRFINEKQKVINLPIDKLDYICTVTTIEPREDVGGIVVSLMSTESIKQATRKSIGIMAGALVGLLAISTAVSFLMSRRMVKPVLHITELTKRYAKRDFSDKYIAETNDEIRELSLAVCDMAESLESQDKEKDKLFRQISHEIKTPLTAIYGYAEGIKTGVFKDVDEPIDAIMRESMRIQKLTENIIYLSKLESSVESFSFGLCDITEIVARAIESVESLAILKDIDIHYAPKQIEKLRVDEEKMYRALINILTNCIKYTNDSITIEIVDDNNTVEIIISDNGNGFGDQNINDILSGLTRAKSNGSGIGLSIVNEIVKAHGGQFIIGNNPSGGAEFKIILGR